MDNTPSGLKVALYARVSGEEQKQGHNIDSQIAELEAFARQREWSIVEIYKDEAWSGAALARPALDKLRDDASKRRFEAVLINDVDRLARDVTHLGVIKRDLEKNGVRVIFRKIPSESSPTQNLLVNILGSFAEFERELILDRTRRGRRHKVETRQQFLGCIPPYGYRYIPMDGTDHPGTLTINPEEAVIVRRMFDWVDRDGHSMRAVCRRLTKEGVPPRKGGKAWGKSSVGRILRSTVYSGTWHYNKLQGCYPRYLPPEHQAGAKKTSTRQRGRDEWIPVALPESLRLIPVDQWQRVQAQIDRNRVFSPRNTKHQYLLSGLLRCGGCGYSYVGEPCREQFSYRCSRRCKRTPSVSENFVNETVWNAVEEALRQPTILQGAVTSVNRPKDSLGAEEVGIAATLKGLDAEEARIMEAYRLEVLTAEQLSRELGLLSGRRKILDGRQKEMAKASTQNPIHQTVEDYCKTIRDRLGDLTFETKRSILRLLLKKIVFEGGGVTITGIIPLSAASGIAATGINHLGRNSTHEKTAFAEFLLVRPLVHPTGRVFYSGTAPH